MTLHRLFRRHNNCRSAVIDPRRISCGDGAIWFNDWPELAQHVERAISRMLIRVKNQIIFFPALYRNGYNFIDETPILNGLSGFLLTSLGK